MQTLFIGKKRIFLPQMSSTNSYATDLLKNVNQPEGTLIHTDLQTAGKGQRGAAWLADSGQNLTASIILKPVFLPLHKQFLLYKITALACYDTITELCANSQIDIKIKWPNDILVNFKKVAGILIENNIQHNLLQWSVIGVGINLNQTDFHNLPHASSLKLITKHSINPAYCLDLVCMHLEKYYLSLMNAKFENIRESYLNRLFGTDNFYPYEINHSVVHLRVRGISAAGLLVLESKAGESIELDVKDAKLLL